MKLNPHIRKVLPTFAIWLGIGAITAVGFYILFATHTNTTAQNAAIENKRISDDGPSFTTTTIESGKSDEEWKKILTPEQYYILREEGTEVPFTSDLLGEKRQGTFVSADCNEPVFSSEHKYESNTGWPSFYAPINKDAVILREDNSLGMRRIEVLSKCGGHLGHVFFDGPEPSGLRYCINGDALKFIPDEE